MEHTPRSGRSAYRWLGSAALAGLLLTAPAGTGCTGKPGDTSGRGAARQTVESAEWAWLQAAKKALDAGRERLAALPPTDKAGREAAEKEIVARSEELNRRLVDFINAHPLVEGEKPAGRLLDAIRMKSEEDIVLAHQFIDKGGDYRRAIEIYEAALAVDPDNPRLRQELDSARAHRYMTAERFAPVKKGMTQDEVRQALGPPNLRDIRDFPERGISAWFYAKDGDGRAAAVWFSKDKGVYTVYQADFNALAP
jgi:tetratricopeptide (TPR) repeat protein